MIHARRIASIIFRPSFYLDSRCAAYLSGAAGRSCSAVVVAQPEPSPAHVWQGNELETMSTLGFERVLCGASEAEFVANIAQLVPSKPAHMYEITQCPIFCQC